MPLETKRQMKVRQPWVFLYTLISLHVEKTLVPSNPLHLSIYPPPTHPSKDVMTTLVNNMKTYAVVAAMRCAPHIQNQKATGRPKGITTTGHLTTEVGAIKPTTDQLHQGTTGLPMGVAKVQIMQPQGNAKSKLCKVLYEIFDIKEPIITETKDPIEVNVLCFTGKYHCHGIASQVNHKFYKNSMWPQDNGHKYAPPSNKLMRSLECFHCHKKGHYAHHCQVRHQVNHD